LVSPNPILTTIIFVFALQALLLSVLLLRKKPRNLSNIFLALLVFFFALMALNIALVTVLRSYDLFHLFRYVQLELMFGIGPAIYFYTKSITQPTFKFSSKELIHFIPVVLEFIFYRTSFYRLGADGLYEATPHPYTKIYLIEQWLGIISITVYTLLSLQLFFQHQKGLKQHYSNLEKKTLKWLRTPLLIYSGFWIGWNILTEIDRFAFDRAYKEAYFLPTFVGLAIVTCWIGFKDYIRSQVAPPTHATIKKTKFDTNPQHQALAKDITKLMSEQKPYLDADLDLSKLSELLEANPKQVSAAINQHFEKNFYEYINSYRVEAFKARMIQADSDKLTLLGHAFECGFKSKSTFNHVFKKISGKTPSDYVKQLKKESEKKQSVASQA